MFTAISFLFGICSAIGSIISLTRKGASSFMKKELNTYYLGSKGIR